ncbi:MAG: GNAT family N-acetyltransferase [Patescibacteria group bacterium]|nr:GNAT family N-acetyltransferase [Patescibacteria group bacterium]
MVKLKITKIERKDRNLIKKFIKNRWGSDEVVYNGKIFLPHKLSGFVVKYNQKLVGLITYKKYKNYLWIVTIDSLIEKKGIGTRLINTVKKEAKNLGIKKIKLRTTNDNLNALRFYQKRGFRITKIYKGAVDYSRKIKPTIPLVGENRIPIHDEIELEINDIFK